MTSVGNDTLYQLINIFMAKFTYEKIRGIEEISREIKRTVLPHVYRVEEIVEIHGVTYLCKSVEFDYSIERID